MLTLTWSRERIRRLVLCGLLLVAIGGGVWGYFAPPRQGVSVTLDRVFYGGGGLYDITFTLTNHGPSQEIFYGVARETADPSKGSYPGTMVEAFGPYEIGVPVERYLQISQDRGAERIFVVATNMDGDNWRGKLHRRLPQSLKESALGRALYHSFEESLFTKTEVVVPEEVSVGPEIYRRRAQSD